MSRIGKLPISLPSWVSFERNGAHITIKGPKWSLKLETLPSVHIDLESNTLTVRVDSPDNKQQRAYWGLTRALLQNMVTGVSEGYKKSLDILGVGYKFDVKGPRLLELSVGYSHKVKVDAPEGITIEADKEEKNRIHISSFDKQLLGYFSAKIRSIKPPEPYKGKGIRYTNEQIRRKAGKTAGK